MDCSRVALCSRWRRTVALMIFSAAISLGTARAGQEQDASILGQVTDESGAILPGVTVTATSPSLQVPQVSAITNERGEYRLTPLPIGTYMVTYELSGFQSIRREGIRLTTGFIAKMDVAMKVGSLSETITVSGAAPVVDVTTTSSRTQLTRETLELVPSSRNGVIGLMQQAPGVRTNLDVGGSALVSVPTFRAFGQSNESWQTIEGVVTTSPKSNNQSGNYWDYSTIEEARVQTLGNDAEMPTRGVQIVAVLKSGGNDFHGDAFWGQTNHNLQNGNVDDALRAQGVTSGNTIETRRDVSGDLGGRLVKDKLWFYASARARKEAENVLGVFQPNGAPGVTNQLQEFGTGKLSYQLTSSNKIVGFLQWSHKIDNSGASTTIAWESRSEEHFNSPTTKVEWQAVHGNSLVTSLQYGYWHWDSTRLGFSPNPSARDLVTLLTTGDVLGQGELPFESRHQIRGSASWYKPDWFHGNHDFKGGFEYLLTGQGRGYADRGSAGNYQLIFNGGVPFEFYAFNWPISPTNLVHYTDLYGQDTWTIARRLTLNLGIRYAHDNGFVPAQSFAGNAFFPGQSYPFVQDKIWNAVAPRLHASYDLTGDAKTVIKGGWGRYNHMRLNDEVGLLNKDVQTATLFRWHDSNGNNAFDPGEVNFDRNGSDFVSSNVTSGGSTTATGGLAGAVVSSNELEPKADEFFSSIERQLIPDLAVRFTGVFTRAYNSYKVTNLLRPYSAYTIAVTKPDPGPDGKVGTADDPGTTVTYYDYPTSLGGVAFQLPTLQNDPLEDQSYKSFEVAASKRLSKGWQFLASYSATRRHEPIIANTGGGNTPLFVTDDPNARINAADETWERTAKLSGSYELPYKVMLSTNFLHQTGMPWGRTVLVTGGPSTPTLVVRVEPIGTRKLPDLNLLDLRVEKSIRFPNRQNLSLRANIYNATNSNIVTGLTMQSGAKFSLPSAILQPRIVELTASYTF
jgi:hypothetical protein